MAGRIRDEDIAAVRENVRHRRRDRRARRSCATPAAATSRASARSTTRSPRRCRCRRPAGCSTASAAAAGGDVIRFVERIEHLSFAEAVESLAGRAGIQLRYAEGGAGPNRPSGQRARLVEAHTLAAAFYAEQLRSPEARRPASSWPSGASTRRGQHRFGCGYAPAGWDPLTKHLLGRGFSPDELTLAGLARRVRPRRARSTGSTAGCCGRSGTSAAMWSASAPAGSTTTTRSRPSTSTPPRPRSTRRASCSTAWTWPSARSPGSARRSSSRATPT